ncbi:hypothetical protein HNQ34_000690 [Anoxybacillus tepidamans]|uniref:Uncharacterized protein n=1 Tax=Anoxybacteroides tepidamans TaxID=265948 RepID=A0A7W8IN77_9BACL|nr:hypothetical protein [Anoxybacillus tepidamans]
MKQEETATCRSLLVFKTFRHIVMLIILTINVTTFKMNMYILQKSEGPGFILKFTMKQFESDVLSVSALLNFR